MIAVQQFLQQSPAAMAATKLLICISDHCNNRKQTTMSIKTPEENVVNSCIPQKVLNLKLLWLFNCVVLVERYHIEMCTLWEEGGFTV